MPEDDMDFLLSNYRRLKPAEFSRLQRQVAERARALRTEFLRDLWRSFVNWHRARTAVAQLNGLDDAALKDIGLHRSGIETAVINGLAAPTPRPKPAFAEKPHLCPQRTVTAPLKIPRDRTHIGRDPQIDGGARTVTC